METILCAAIQYNSRPWNGIRASDTPEHYKHEGLALVMCGHRHNNIIRQFFLLTGRPTGPSNSVQGFLTSTGRFVTRVEAAEIALASGQIKELKYFKLTKELDSSDLY